MAAFPSGQITHSGFKYALKKDVLRTPMDSGPPKQALRSSRKYKEFDVTYNFTKTEFILFNNFVENTINFVESFDWTDPLSEGVVTARIIGGDISDARPLNPHLENWIVRMRFEVL